MGRSSKCSSGTSSTNSSPAPSRASSQSSIDTCPSLRHDQAFPHSLVHSSPHEYTVEEVVPDLEHRFIKRPSYALSRIPSCLENDAHPEMTPGTFRPPTEKDSRQRVSTFQATFRDGTGADGRQAILVSVGPGRPLRGFTVPLSHVTMASKFAEEAANWIPSGTCGGFEQDYHGSRAALIAQATGEHPYVSVMNGQSEGGAAIEGATQIRYNVRDP